MKRIERRAFLQKLYRDALILGGSAALLPACATRARLRDGRKLNFVFFLIDDMGWKDLGCFGSTFYETSHIDTLARDGMRFTDAYAAAPICSPTRASILTGKYPARLHLTEWLPGRVFPYARLTRPDTAEFLPLEEMTIAEALRPAGYVSGSVGKWHLGDEPYRPDKQGFDLNFGGDHSGFLRSYFYPYSVPAIQDGREGEYLTDRVTEEALKFIEGNRDTPFFLYVPHYAVHGPHQAKDDLIAKYQAKVRPGQQQNNPVFAAMIHSVDESVGRVMAKLEELGIADHTALFFTSDNGALQEKGVTPVTSNAPLRAGKGTLYEGGIRVPSIVRWPGIVEPGSVCDAPVISTDFYLTILEMAGVRDHPKHVVDGVSIVPLLRQSGGLTRDAVYWHFPHYNNRENMAPAGAIRQGDYKLIEFFEDGRLELYSLREDIGEQRNLAEELPQKAAQLRDSLKKWQKTVGAQMPEPNPDYDPDRIRVVVHRSELLRDDH